MNLAHRLRPSPAMVVACVALTLALAGTGYAAVKLPKNSVGQKRLKRNAVTSIKVKDRSLLAKDFKRGQLPKGARGDTGAQGIQGVQGPPGPFPQGDLPAGKTLRGNWIASVRAVQALDYGFDTISFGHRFAAAPTAHLLEPGAPATPECPGTLAAPEAASGHLCLYTYQSVNVGNRYTCNPLTNTCGLSEVNRYGTTVRVNALAPGAAFLGNLGRDVVA